MSLYHTPALMAKSYAIDYMQKIVTFDYKPSHLNDFLDAAQASLQIAGAAFIWLFIFLVIFRIPLPFGFMVATLTVLFLLSMAYCYAFKFFNSPKMVKFNLIFEEILFFPCTFGILSVPSTKQVVVKRKSKITFTGLFFKYKISFDGLRKNAVRKIEFKATFFYQKIMITFKGPTNGTITLRYKGALYKTPEVE